MPSSILHLNSMIGNVYDVMAEFNPLAKTETAASSHSFEHKLISGPEQFFKLLHMPS